MPDGDRKTKTHELETELKTKVYRKLPGYIFSNDLFENWIKESLKSDSVWIDAGCGKNALVEEFSNISPHGIGIDTVVHPELDTSKSNFIKAELEKIPLPDSYADTIVMNMVVEHIKDVDMVLKEINRVLKPDGNLIFRTTNKWYPTQLFGNILPKGVKDTIIHKIFGVESHDIFKTYYRINTLRRIRKVLPHNGFDIYRLSAVEDLHLFSRFAFFLSVRLYLVQRLGFFSWTRNCIVCWAKKRDIK